MDKIISAINSMVERSKLITDVRTSSDVDHSNEYFFKYKDKYIWGISKTSSGDYMLFFYPDAKGTQELSSLNIQDFNYMKFRTFKSENFNTQEALDSFAALYNCVEEMADGFNEVLDDIIEAPPF